MATWINEIGKPVISKIGSGSCAAVLQHLPCSSGWNYSFDSPLMTIWLSL
jgi:hypothetical protein